jgi:NAD+ synthase
LKEVSSYIIDWLNSYSQKSNTKGFVIGISGGVDSALTSTLCALTRRKVILVNMPILQTSAEYQRAQKHIEDLKSRFENVEAVEIDLTSVFQSFSSKMPFETESSLLAMANSRARIRMTALYAIAQVNGCLVAGTGNKIEDFGIGFYTKYGDGGVDLSPIADLTKTQVFKLILN